MTDITANVIVSMPSQLFTMARSFKAVANGKIYIGKIDTDPVNPENQIQVYVENEDGSHIPVSQPIIINAAGYPVYNGQIAKFVTVQGHSMAVYDTYGAQQFYFPNVLKYDPDQFRQELEREFASGAFPETVKYKYGLPSVVDGAVYRTVQDKLDDFVFLEDFGGKDDGGITDNSLAFKKAFASGAKKIYLRGSGVYAMATRDIELPARYEIIGNAKNPEIKYLGSDSTFTMFTLTGSGPAASQWKQGGIFRDVIISSDTVINWMVCRHVQNLDFDRVYFYNSRTLMNNYHYVNFFRCERWSSGFEGRSDLNTVNFISESPKFLMCFSSNSPIDVWDTADLSITFCTFFAGDYAVQTKVTLVSPTAPDQFAGYPVFISNSVFDAVSGSAWLLNGIAYGSIIGNLVSSGRDATASGAVVDGVRSTIFTGNTFTYCGAYGLELKNFEQCSIASNVMNGNKIGGLLLQLGKESSIIGGVVGTSYIRGGYYTQQVGITDAADTCTGITVNGVSFDSDLATKIYLNTQEGKNNRIVACHGVKDSQIVDQNRGPTSNRPTSPVAGQQYYDSTLGLPIWWNSVSGTWKRADGVDA
ncbi:right-handed parallel beta-helix repeat-containing protein [Escherichia coli]|nr:right-handed parallel beta-helix repeat-containing protein [Escherichia coli]NJR30079.1 right-handed parallel beta-helix repeat-containing protein [Escherichia coli]NJR91259.1 right-handed parallel beta-helix repeat-containing protein [Escherichia coli]NJR96126.1 right-handed parallel beta-helix repeat-containing protein [Escherichia coli]NJU21837.1 right-handed parallel beta-helix repeat-containing protein [Escherichia coli]